MLLFLANFPPFNIYIYFLFIHLLILIQVVCYLNQPDLQAISTENHPSTDN